MSENRSGGGVPGAAADVPSPQHGQAGGPSPVSEAEHAAPAPAPGSGSGSYGALIDFAAVDAESPPMRLAFGAPRRALAAHAIEDVQAVIRAAEAEARRGAWCIGYVRYEASPAFDAALVTDTPGDGPLAWFAVHDEPLPWPDSLDGDYAPLQWRADLSRGRFDAVVDDIHEAIARGEVYQINLTAPLRSVFHGSARALFGALQRAQPKSYAAFIDTGDEQVLSVSPELFFDWRGGRIVGRPMKGTAPRGATPEADAAQAERLRSTEKERAENLMIVDLIRNDLSRIALPNSVTVPRLFETQAWPTVWQMTSDVVARTRPDVTLVDVFTALFPCGSVTGAPKVQASRLIHALEDGPRGVYCGAVGLLQPGGAATFNVAIRTVALRDGRAVCGIGSGITADATAEGEWQEWRNKRGFLDRAEQPFSLLETLRLEDGVFRHLERHLARMKASAEHFGHAWPDAAVRQKLQVLAARHPTQTWRVRLTLDAAGRLQAQVQADAPLLLPRSGRLRVRLADRPLREAHGEFVRHKTTRRSHYDAFAANDPRVFDTLLWNEAGELTEFTRGNLALRRQGRWLTPALSCGLLGGVERALLIESGALSAAVLRREDLLDAEGLAFINSLRGWLNVDLMP